MGKGKTVKLLARLSLFPSFRSEYATPFLSLSLLLTATNFIAGLFYSPPSPAFKLLHTVACKADRMLYPTCSAELKPDWAVVLF